LGELLAEQPKQGRYQQRVARDLYRPDLERRPVSLRKVAAGLADLGFVTPSGKPSSASAVGSMIGRAA